MQQEQLSEVSKQLLSRKIMVEANYFTCTLGQASLLQKDPGFKNINEFIEQQAARASELPAVGFYTPGTTGKSSWKTDVLTFSDVHKGTCVVAGLISSKTVLQKRCAVALLCPSSAEFLFLWLALIRLGHPVLLLAPQCSASAIVHLCKSCEVNHLFHDEMYEDLSSKASQAASKSGDWTLSCSSIKTFWSESIYDIIKQEPKRHSPAEEVSEHDVAYLHHTSGTSSGAPKPIPQTHRAGVGVLPTLDGKHEATFTTTPLFHGGIADLFRAWTSSAMIWLFPGKGLPITPTNIVHCLEIAQHTSDSTDAPQIKYFSSVPYILQLMAADETGLEKLQCMAIVGVGGAALPNEIGQKLVQQDVNLISRFGSAECGFLMSSHRAYAKDKEWQYLRLGQEVNTLRFEQRDDGLSELIALPGWPHLAKKNREDGSYATADLFEPHSTIKNAWKYHSRADSQLTLNTGKKFDPAPLEAAIATSKLLKDVFIFGDGKPYPGALLFRSEEGKVTSDEQLIADLEPTLRQIHTESQSHVQLARHMLVPMPFLNQPLEKSSKGTTLRKIADEQYKNMIEKAYTKGSLADGKTVEDEQVASTVKQIVAVAVGRDDGLEHDTDLFSYGVDSVACVQIRHALSSLLPELPLELPPTVVEDCGTISRLSELIVSRRHGRHHVTENPQQLMPDLVEKYSHFVDLPPSNGPTASQRTDEDSRKSSGETILLTGATGALGSHILHAYMGSHDVARIICLVRGSSEYAAAERIRMALAYRKLKPPNSKVEVLCTDLSSPLLGLDQSKYQTLASMVTIIHHVAWAVNFRLSLPSFLPNLASLQNLINFALSSPYRDPPEFIFCSSVASIADHPAGQAVREEISSNFNDCGPLGYSRSKWIAERICDRANQQTRLQGRIAVMRVGQLSGATETGIWNMNEAYPMLLSQVSLTNCLPDLQDLPLTWLPVDVAAKSFLGVAASIKKGMSDKMQVYHVVNTETSTEWKDLLIWIKKLHNNIETMPPAAFVRKLQDLQRSGSEHPAMRLIPHWRETYGDLETSGECTGQASEKKEVLTFEMTKTYAAAPVLQKSISIDEAYIGRIWNWMREQG